MPHKMKKESNRLGVVITFSGIVKEGEIHKANEKLDSDKIFSKVRYEIWDFSKIEDIKVTFDELRNLAIQDSATARKNPDKKIAIIVRKISSSGLDMMYHAYEKAWGGYESKTFTDIEAARQWAQSG